MVHGNQLADHSSTCVFQDHFRLHKQSTSSFAASCHRQWMFYLISEGSKRNALQLVIQGSQLLTLQSHRVVHCLSSCSSILKNLSVKTFPLGLVMIECVHSSSYISKLRFSVKTKSVNHIWSARCHLAAWCVTFDWIRTQEKWTDFTIPRDLMAKETKVHCKSTWNFSANNVVA